MEFIETIRIKNGRPENMEGHIERMRTTAEHFGFLPPKVPELSVIMPGYLKTGLTKCRLLYDRLIREIKFEAYKPKKISSFVLVDAGSLDYAFKYADRRVLECEDRKFNGFEEVIFLKDGFLTDTSFSNIVFRKGKEFVTPTTFLLNGTRRQYLLKSGHIKEEEVHMTELGEYDELILINAMMGLKDGLHFPPSVLRAEGE